MTTITTNNDSLNSSDLSKEFYQNLNFCHQHIKKNSNNPQPLSNLITNITSHVHNYLSLNNLDLSTFFQNYHRSLQNRSILITKLSLIKLDKFLSCCLSHYLSQIFDTLKNKNHQDLLKIDFNKNHDLIIGELYTIDFYHSVHTIFDLKLNIDQHTLNSYLSESAKTMIQCTVLLNCDQNSQANKIALSLEQMTKHHPPTIDNDDESKEQQYNIVNYLVFFYSHIKKHHLAYNKSLHLLCCHPNQYDIVVRHYDIIYHQLANANNCLLSTYDLHLKASQQFCQECKKHKSWKGYQYITSLLHQHDLAKFSDKLQHLSKDQLELQSNKMIADHFEQYFSNGERSQDFLIQYSGTLGACGMYHRIPQILWQCSLQITSYHWKIHLHLLQAHLAMGKDDQAKKLAELFNARKDISDELKQYLCALEI